MSAPPERPSHSIACPLTHADFLLARTSDELDQRFHRRELTTCPPTVELQGRNGEEKRLTYEKDRDRPMRFLHDATFAAVRWTNIHDAPPNRFLFLIGDVIAGPVARLFGRGVVDINVQPTWNPGFLPSRLFTHTIYWRMNQSADSGSPPASVQTVRNAINILDEDQVEAELIAQMNRQASHSHPL